MSLNDAWQNVYEFHVKFKHPHRNIPKKLEPERANARYNWMLEEINEFIEADSLPDQVDAMIDLIYFALGTLVEVGVKPDRLFDIVHSANIKKAFEDGEVKFNTEGKTIKPPGWIDPFPLIKEEIKKQHES